MSMSRPNKVNIKPPIILGSLLGLFAFSLVSSVYAQDTLQQGQGFSHNLLVAQNRRFPLRGSKFTELGDHRRMETQITISNNRRIDGVTRIWTDKQLKGFTGSVAVAITDRAGNVLYVTNPKSWGVDCKRCPGPSHRTEGWSDSIPPNVFSQVGGYAIIHTTSPRDRWRNWLSTAGEAAREIKGIYNQF